MDQFIQFVISNWYLWLGVVVILVLIVQMETSKTVMGVKMLEPQELVMAMNHDKAIVIDIRESNTFASGHILGAKNIPMNELTNNKQLEKQKNSPIVLVDANGHQVAKIGSALLKQGFGSVTALKSGISAWTSAGMPLTKN